MPRRKKPGMAMRHLRVHLESYNWIKEFFESSPTEVTLTDACCEVLHQFGIYCKQQMDLGAEASQIDLENASNIILGDSRNNDD